MLSLERRYLDEIVAHARDELPNEACGIVVGKDGVPVKLFRGRNTEASPYRYYLDNDQLFQIQRECWANGWDFLAIYHSHTKSKAYPSPTDVRLAYWPDAYYVIISLRRARHPTRRAFRILNGLVREEKLRIVER
jgi:proteasome lid subunit RPN8/RPN11